MMGDKTGIQWTDATWNPIVGCSIVSPGCTNCYAMKMAARIERMAPKINGTPHSLYTGTTRTVKGNAVWTGIMRMGNDSTLSLPLRWKRPRRIFVNSMGDLFHESVPDAWIDRVFAVMALAPQHTFQVLTKRSKRMREYLERLARSIEPLEKAAREIGYTLKFEGHGLVPFPLPNVHLGVSAEDQTHADERIPDLLATPAAVRFVSAEPLLGPIDLTPEADATYQRLSEWYGPNGFDPSGQQERLTRRKGYFPKIDWVIVGGESGRGARPMHPDWARSIRDQCAIADVAFFFKQWGEWLPFDQGVHLADSRTSFNVHGGDHYNARAYKAGKKAAGRLLDGIEHNEMPA